MTAEYQRQWRAKNKDKVAACNKKYAQKESVKAYRRKYNAVYRQSHKDEAKEYMDKYYEANKPRFFEKALKRVHTKRALKNNGLSDAYTRGEVFKRYGGYCIVCDLQIDTTIKWPHPETYTIHHIMPLSKGGDDTLNNVAPAHWKCNLEVGNKVPVAVKAVVFNG